MVWFERRRWKIGIAIAGMLFLLLLMVWTPLSTVGAHEGVLGLAGPGMVTLQVTPTEDATVTALNKEKLAQEVQQLKSQNETDPLAWLRTNASIFLSTLAVVIGGLFGLWRWRVDRKEARDKELVDQKEAQDKELNDHQAERERRDEEQKRWLKDQEAERDKRAEERFQAAVTGLSDEREGAKIGAAILLRTFLRPGYEQFYIQTFDLAVAHLRLRQTSPSSPEEDPDNPLPLTTLTQALIVAFKETFPRARSQNKESPQSLDATGIQLDLAYLEDADLDGVWMPQAFLRKANLSRAKLIEAELHGAVLIRADLSEANLSWATLSWADLREAKLSGVTLVNAYLRGAYLRGADLCEADLEGAKLSRAKLFKATLSGVIGLTREQLETFKAQGAIIDDDPTTTSSQSAVSTSSPPQSNSAQAPSPPSVQGSTPPTPDTDGSSATSSQQGTES